MAVADFGSNVEAKAEVGGCSVSLSDRLTHAEPSKVGRPCAVGALLGALPEVDADALRLALSVQKGDRSRLSSPVISKILAEEGYDVGAQSITKHRSGACRCGIIGEINSA